MYHSSKSLLYLDLGAYDVLSQLQFYHLKLLSSTCQAKIVSITIILTIFALVASLWKLPDF